jgi:hypothetical protein
MATPTLAAARAAKAARRLAPFALEAWRRWERLPEEEKARYRERALGATEKGRDALARFRERRRRGQGPPPPGTA